MSGRLLRVVAETARGADGLVIPRDRVTLLTDSGIEQFILEMPTASLLLIRSCRKMSPPRYRDLPLTARTDVDA